MCSPSRDLRALLFALFILFCVPFESVGGVVEPQDTHALATQILVLGDSLSAAYGIDISQGWVHLLQRRLESRGFEHRVVNASISGETTRGGLARLEKTLDSVRPGIVIVALGGNDGLRGLSLVETRSNLAAILQTVIDHGARVVLVGMRLPPNYGPEYTQRFEAIYVELAKQFATPLVPFLLDGVAEDPSLMQLDGLHPRAEAQPALLDNVWVYLDALIP